jgi:hypothetical protein
MAGKVCKQCGRPGQTKGDCPERVCFHCLGKGHEANRCSKYAQEYPGLGESMGRETDQTTTNMNPKTTNIKPNVRSRTTLTKKPQPIRQEYPPCKRSRIPKSTRKNVPLQWKEYKLKDTKITRKPKRKYNQPQQPRETPQQELPLLGATISAGDYSVSTWEPPVAKLEKRLSSLQGRQLTFQGKTTVINTLALSQIWHLFMFL